MVNKVRRDRFGLHPMKHALVSETHIDTPRLSTSAISTFLGGDNAPQHEPHASGVGQVGSVDIATPPMRWLVIRRKSG